MSEDILIKVTADTGQADASLKKTQAATKAIGDEATATGAKSKSAFDWMSRNVLPVAAAYMAVRLAMRGVREVLSSIEDAADKNSLVNGELKSAAIIAQKSIEGLGDAFGKFKQTASSAVAPIVKLLADDLTGALDSTTKNIEANTEAVSGLAMAYASIKTVIVIIGEVANAVFQGLRMFIADILIIAGKANQAFASLASVVSKDMADSLRSTGDVMEKAGYKIGEQALSSFKSSGAKLGEAFSGEVYDKTMKGFDKISSDIQKKTAELSKPEHKPEKESTATETARKKILAEIASIEANMAERRLMDSNDYDAHILKAYRSDLENEKEKLEALEKTKKENDEMLKDWEKIRIESKKTETELKANDNERLWRLENQAKMAEIIGKNIGKEVEGISEKRKIKTEVSTEVSGSIEDMQRMNPQEEANKRFNEALEAERQSLLDQEDFKQEHKDRILAIEEAQAGGAIRIQNEAVMKEARLNKQRVISAEEMADGVAGALGNLAVLMQSKNRTVFEIGRAAALAQNVINTIRSAEEAYLYGQTISGGNVIVGAAFAATAVAAGAMRASMLLSASPSGGGAGAGGGGGYTDTSNVGGPGGGTTQGAGVGASSQVNVSLYGERFGADQVRGLIDAINAETKDGKKVTVKV